MRRKRDGHGESHGARLFGAVCLGVSILVLSACTTLPRPNDRGTQTCRTLPVHEYESRMRAGWLGQVVGVTWGAPTEFHYCGRTIPAEEMPAWTPDMVNNAFGQDDLYVEMTFLKTLDTHGFGVTPRQAGLDFAASRYGLFHANDAGRANLRRGIAAPDSGHPAFNPHADDIDFQIEADFAGLIAPGLPNTAIELGELFGHLMNYGDGVYGGQFVAGMYAEAFFQRDPETLVRAGLACIPEGSQYHECIADVLAWYRADPGNWQATWQKIEDKYQRDPRYRRFSCNREGWETNGDPFNIDAKINGAYIAMGLLYGQGDIERTIEIATRCGQDSDCNPSNAAGILFTALGWEAVPDRYRAIDQSAEFAFTGYTFPALTEVCSGLAREAVLRAGGRAERRPDGSEVFVIPVRTPLPTTLEQSWSPSAPTGSRYSEQELAPILAGKPVSTAGFAPEWTVSQCGYDMEPGLYASLFGREHVLATHPFDQRTPCVLEAELQVPDTPGPVLRLEVGHHPRGDWLLIVHADGEELLRAEIDAERAPDGYCTVEVGLSAFRGRTVPVRLLNQPTGWMCEAAYWDSIELLP